MPAIGFGMKVTGGGTNPRQIKVKSGADKGADTLAEDLKVQAKNLTIRAEKGAIIRLNHIVIDCREADNILLQDLRFEPDKDGEVRKGKTRDSISIDGSKGRGPIGIWIDHCFFEAFFDLSVTSNTRDLPGAPPLLITVSYCHFHDNDPGGQKADNHGALGIHGAGSKNNKKVDQETNAYATVYRNFFESVRRRSPRSSNRTFVHAFNTSSRSGERPTPAATSTRKTA
jgi:pectate lyase